MDEVFNVYEQLLYAMWWITCLLITLRNLIWLSRFTEHDLSKKNAVWVLCSERYQQPAVSWFCSRVTSLSRILQSQKVAQIQHQYFHSHLAVALTITPPNPVKDIFYKTLKICATVSNIVTLIETKVWTVFL